MTRIMNRALVALLVAGLSLPALAAPKPVPTAEQLQAEIDDVTTWRDDLAPIVAAAMPEASDALQRALTRLMDEGESHLTEAIEARDEGEAEDTVNELRRARRAFERVHIRLDLTPREARR